MSNISLDPLQAFGDFILGLLQPLFDFIVGFLPNGDPQIYAIIDQVGMVGGDFTFNVFWFVEWNCVLACFAVLVSVSLVVHLIKFVMSSINTASKAVEAIPVIE